MVEQLPGGYAGKILRINLSDNTTSVEETDEKFCRKYIGGANFIAYRLHKKLKPRIDLLDPDNKLISTSEPLTGASLTGSRRHVLITRTAFPYLISSSVKHVPGRESPYHPRMHHLQSGNSQLRHPIQNSFGKPILTLLADIC